MVLKKEAQQLEDKIEELRDGLESPKVARYTHDPKGHGTTTADLVAKMVDMEQLYRNKRDQLLDMLDRIEAVIAKLDGLERVLMRSRYLDGHDWEKIAIDLNYSIAQVFRIHGRILQKIARLGGGGK